MKKIILTLFVIGVFLTSCDNSKSKPSTNPNTLTLDGKEYTDYSEYTVAQVNKMKSPVTLIGKDKSMGCYGVSLKDSNDVIVHLGNMSSFAQSIGESRKVGDTIK